MNSILSNASDEPIYQQISRSSAATIHTRKRKAGQSFFTSHPSSEDDANPPVSPWKQTDFV